MDLFQKKTFTSHSGLELNWKIECDAISDAEWDCFATMIMDYQKQPFSKVEGIPRGGLKLAERLQPYATGDRRHQVMIVDDVYTTGGSFKEYVSTNYPNWLMSMGIKWVLFARKPIPRIENINALFTMPSNGE